LTNNECLFCEINHNKIPTEKLFENEHCFIIRDINPQAPIHLLVIAKQHIAQLSEINAENVTILSRMVLEANHAAKKFRITESGYRLLINTGADAGMTISHLHIHVLAGKKLGAGN
jgi:histidine triad (HIT) family protein